MFILITSITIECDIIFSEVYNAIFTKRKKHVAMCLMQISYVRQTVM